MPWRGGSAEDTAMNDRALPISMLEPTGAVRASTEHTFETHDGVALFYRHWRATANAARGAIVLLHRGHEHSGRMGHLPGELDLPDFDFFAWDARGHGRSPGARGDSPSFATSVRDVQTFVAQIGERYGLAPESIAIVAQSIGAVVAAAWVHDYAPSIRGMVLASPAFKVKLYVPFALPGLRLMRALRGNFFVTSYVKAGLLTRDPDRAASYDSDPLIARSISVNILLGLQQTADRIVADAAAITVPTQLLLSDRDWVVHDGPQHAFFERLGAATKEKHVLQGFYHDTLGERDRAIAVGHVRRFLLALFDRPRENVDLTDADRRGFTKDEAEALRQPLPGNSPRDLYWRATRGVLRFGATLSNGLRVGRTTGFDSGSMLDYVYRNVASGRTPLGRLVDRVYLDSVGWRGIRQRKLDVEELVADALSRLRAAGRPLHIVDIAAGHGRYVLDAIAHSAIRPDSIVLRDYGEANVRDGSALIRQRGLADIARFVNADAFDRASLEAIEPRPTLGVVSGLYELFADNALVGESLAGLAGAIVPGGFLVYTCQPWHPQLELIARALTSHRGGEPWVMRRRTQAEMDQLVERAGFRKIAQRINEEGLFTVSLAERRG
jgi:alpha-beta hydrolase superfamily lysophospholipase